jgi:hypothetical protein
MFGVSMLQNTFRAEHFLITFTEKFHFFVFVHITVLYSTVFCSGCTLSRVCVHLSHWQSSQDCIIDRKVVGRDMMRDLIKWTFDDGMFVYLTEAFEAESVPAREGQWFLFRVVVLLETHATFKYRIHANSFLT